MSYLHSANRAQFAKPAGITIEYSTDGGSTWTDYGATDAQKIALVSGIGSNFYIGKKTSSITTNDKLRITVDALACGIYTALKTVLINFSSSGAQNSTILIEQALMGSKTTFTTIGTYGISGWSGWNSYPVNLGTFGGSSGQTSNIDVLRFTLSIGSVNSSYSNAATISDMLFFGTTYWQYPSNMAKTGHLYSWDYNQNATFPANITANSGTITGKYLTASTSATTPQITISSAAGLKYTGIESGTSNVNRKVWFADASSAGTPVVSANFQYNPSTNVLTVGSITGKAGTAGTADKVANSLSINGKTFNGSSATDVGTIGIGYGGTGATTAAAALKNLIGTTAIGSSTKPIYWSGSAFAAISSYEGNAATATAFSSNRTVALTGDVTGSASGTGSSGWSVATTIGSGKVTNAMLAGSIANGKLANSSVTIAGNSVSLGGSITADTLRTSLGLSNAMHFVGIATVAITDGSTTDPTISGYSTKAAGDVIIDKDSSYEYVWSGSKWERLGGDSSYKTTQTAVSDPAASGNSSTFIKSISQNSNGVITATKATIANHVVQVNGTAAGTYNGSAAVTLNLKESSGINISNSSGTITFAHANSVTAKTAYGSTATTASANGGSFTVTDVKYDAQGHITGSTDRTITLSQTTYTLAGLGGVPTTRTVNGKALSANISLSYTDVGAAATSHTHTWSQISDNATCTINTSGTITGSKVYGAVWNDYAEFRKPAEEIYPGRAVYSDDQGELHVTTERLQPFEGIVSDTFGFGIGYNHEATKPLAVAGRVLAYPDVDRNEFHAGDTVCAGPNGTVSKMTREEIVAYPDRIIGVVSEIPNYEVWKAGYSDTAINVQGRIWVRI